MPMPRYHIDMEQYCYYRARAKVCDKRSLLPRRCFLSGKSLFLKKAVKVTSQIDGPGTPVIESHWVDAKEFLLDELKR